MSLDRERDATNGTLCPITQDDQKPPSVCDTCLGLHTKKETSDLTPWEFQQLHPELNPAQIAKLLERHLEKNPDCETPLRSINTRFNMLPKTYLDTIIAGLDL